MSSATFKLRVPASHPSLPGHFPGQPIVPGVVLLDLVVASVPASMCASLSSLASAKFLKPVLPEEALDVTLAFEDAIDGRLRARATATRGDETVFEASLVFAVSPK